MPHEGINLYEDDDLDTLLKIWHNAANGDDGAE